MARKFRRSRRTFRRVSPDRAWLLTEFGIEMQVGTLLDTTLIPDQGEVLMTFNDITAEEDSLNREDSDWFVQRIIMNWLPNMGALESTDLRYAKLYEWCLFTMHNRMAEETEMDVSQDVINDAVFNRSARILQTGVNPIHAHWNPRVNLGSGALQTGSGGSDTGVAATPWLGSEHVHVDIAPKFGLKEGVNLYMSIGPFLKSDVWPEVQTFSIVGKAQILVQRKARR